MEGLLEKTHVPTDLCAKRNGEKTMIRLKPELFQGLDTVEGLRKALQTAIQLEFSTIPPYLYAL